MYFLLLRSLKQGWRSLGQHLDQLAEHHKEKVVVCVCVGGARSCLVDELRCIHTVLSVDRPGIT